MLRIKQRLDNLFNFFFFKKVIHFYFKFYFKKNKNVFFIYYKVLNSFKLIKKQMFWLKNINFNNKQLRSHIKTYNSRFTFVKTDTKPEFNQGEVSSLHVARQIVSSNSLNYDFFTNSTFDVLSTKNSSKVSRVQSRSITFPFSKKGRVI